MPLGSLRRGMRLRSLILTVTDRLRPAHMARPLGDNPLLWSTLRGMCVWYGEKAVSARQHHRSKHRPARPQSPRFTDPRPIGAPQMPECRDGMEAMPHMAPPGKAFNFAHLLCPPPAAALRAAWGGLRRPWGWARCARLFWGATSTPKNCLFSIDDTIAYVMQNKIKIVSRSIDRCRGGPPHPPSLELL